MEEQEDYMEITGLCPFCRSINSHPIMDACTDGYFVTCEDIKHCGIDGPVRDTKKEAIEAWNKGTNAPNN